MDNVSAPTKICILCNTSAQLVYEGMSGYVEGTKYDVYECLNCKTGFVDPMSNLKEEYDIIYGNNTIDGTGYYHYLAYGVKKLRKPLSSLFNYSAIFWGVIKAVKDFNVKKGEKILEIGSGLGYLTYAFNKEGYDCEGLDYSDTATNFANNFYGARYKQGKIEEYSNNHKEIYDVVIATEVIEHVSDSNLFIENSLKVLKSGGKIILTTPIKDIHPDGTIWETETPPIHLWWFTEKGIESIAKKFNAQVSFVDFTDYTKNKIWHVHIGTSGTPPHAGPIVRPDRSFINPRKKGYKDILMGILPAWMYIKLVCLYHDLKFLQRNKPDSKYMYGMCAVIDKL